VSARPQPGDPYQAFALALCSQAGIHETARLSAALGSPLTGALRDLTAAGPASDWNQSTGLVRLTDACAPLSSTHRPPSPPEAAALRAVALALAGRATVPGADAPGVLRTVAATVTLIENRGKGESMAGESIILAVV
jgi:hypothetical protein